VLLWITPIVWAIVVAFRPPDDPLGQGDIWFSDRVTTESFETATNLAPFFPQVRDGEITNSYYSNTIQFVLLTLAVQVVTVTLAGFAFAHYRFPGRRILFYFVLLQMMIPTAILLVPNFVTIREFSTATLLIPKFLFHKELNLYDTPWAMAMPYFGSAFGTFLMRQAFLEVPRDLVDSARVDGARWYRVLWHIYLPPSRPTLIAFGLVSVSFHWNELLWPLIVTSDKARPLTMGLLRFTQLTDIGAQWSLVMAATMIIVVPLLGVFLVFQRQFIQSFMHSGLK
jgi:sn-glycerol 3-phosphate transport system permease protein